MGAKDQLHEDFPRQSPYPSTSRERLIALIFILFSSATFFLIQYDRMRLYEPSLEGWVKLKYAGTLSEGDQYRIGVPFFAHFLQVHTGLKLVQSLPLIESVAYTIALISLTALLMRSPAFQSAGRTYRAGLLGLFFAAVQFPVLWIFPWERPETLPVACYLATVLLLILGLPRVPLVVAAPLVGLLSVAQGLTRADATAFVGIATLLAAAIGIPFARPRMAVATLGAICCGVGGAVQLSLKHRFPPLSPSQTGSTLQLFHNLNPLFPPLHLPIFFTAILPLLFTLYLIRRYRVALDSFDKLALLVCLIYLPVYFAFGIVQEVRIYVPYLMLAAPTIAKVWLARLTGDDDGNAPARSSV